jgi:hypothetical protein
MSGRLDVPPTTELDYTLAEQDDRSEVVGVARAPTGALDQSGAKPFAENATSTEVGEQETLLQACAGWQAHDHDEPAGSIGQIESVVAIG